MSPRRRSPGKELLPDNLYERDGYFSYRNPSTGRELGIGRDRRSAVAQAREANDFLAGKAPTLTVADKLAGRDKYTVGTWFDKYDEMTKARIRKDRRVRTPGSLAPNTVKQYVSLSRIARRELGPNTPLFALTPLACSEAFERIAKAGKPKAANSLRQYLRESFREAFVKGWIALNPVLEIRLHSQPVSRARLSFDAFKRIYEATDVLWLKNAMALALVSGQRREDVAGAQFRNFKDDGWYVEQWKTGARLVLPLALRLDCFGMSLDDVRSQCRATGVASQFLVHQYRRRGRSPVSKPIGLTRITAAFTAAVAALGIDWGAAKPPTFHEIRSLSKRLYKAQGGVDTKMLLGHEDDKTAEMYEDTRAREWQRVSLTGGG